MPRSTLMALKQSIKHWEENASITELADAGILSSDCALCKKFFRNSCRGCLVYERTKKKLCMGTPYDKASEAKRKNDLEAFLLAAREEVEFLKSLLPSEPIP
jgi:phosphoribosyl-dephospho-CoA transferase